MLAVGALRPPHDLYSNNVDNITWVTISIYSFGVVNLTLYDIMQRLSKSKNIQGDNKNMVTVKYITMVAECKNAIYFHLNYVYLGRKIRLGILMLSPTGTTR